MDFKLIPVLILSVFAVIISILTMGCSKNPVSLSARESQLVGVWVAGQDTIKLNLDKSLYHSGGSMGISISDQYQRCSGNWSTDGSTILFLTYQSGCKLPNAKYEYKIYWVGQKPCTACDSAVIYTEYLTLTAYPYLSYTSQLVNTITRNPYR